MALVKADITMSLDGFIDGPNNALDRLHRWVYVLESWRGYHGYEGGESNRDSEILAESFETTGAIVIGRAMYNLAEEPWGDEPPFHMPVFVVTHEPKDPIEKSGGTTFHFVEGGIEKALELAREAAGEKDVSVGGGANVIQQFIKLRLLDEIQIHIVPVVIGAGIPLFENMGTEYIEFETTRVVESPEVTHLRLRLKKEEI